MGMLNPLALAMGLVLGDVACVLEDEDDTVFPGMGATCRSCRAKWLWRYALLAARVVRDPVGFSMGALMSLGNGDFLDMMPGVPSAARVDGGEREAEGEEREPQDERDLLHTLSVSPSAPGLFRPEDNVVKGAVSAFVELGERRACGSMGWTGGQRGGMRGSRSGRTKSGSRNGRERGDTAQRVDLDGSRTFKHGKAKRFFSCLESKVPGEMALSNSFVREVPWKSPFFQEFQSIRSLGAL
ncbi:hypothetical protein B0H13DRAFT_2010734 [Mycena leptocephala]|nr:hypothetical protein B0H13DRAFT_2010734 [Mycena leptocephala]